MSSEISELRDWTQNAEETMKKLSNEVAMLKETDGKSTMQSETIASLECDLEAKELVITQISGEPADHLKDCSSLQSNCDEMVRTEGNMPKEIQELKEWTISSVIDVINELTAEGEKKHENLMLISEELDEAKEICVSQQTKIDDLQEAVQG